MHGHGCREFIHAYVRVFRPRQQVEGVITYDLKKDEEAMAFKEGLSAG